ncbi:MAG TPA: phosphoribosylglycinamide formyltransferase [Chthoniobacterales bacterium]
MIRTRMENKIRLGILGSGKGSNFAAILREARAGKLAVEIAAVASDMPGAGILQLAQEAGLPHAVFPESKFRTKLTPEVEQALADYLKKAGADWLILAGYMRVLKAPLLDAFPGKIINIHPSLLPKFRGLAAWKQALEAGETETGCTVHFVDAGVDTGKIIAQVRVPILSGDTAETVHARIQAEEHRLYPEVIARIVSGDLN